MLTRLKGNSRTSEMPIIMLTSLPSAETESASLRLCASNVLVKPCDPASLETMVRIALRERKDAVSARLGHAKDHGEDVGMGFLANVDFQNEDVLAKHSR